MLKDVSYVFLFLALLAEIIGTVGGFGSSVFFVPLANVYLDFNSVLGLTALFHVFSNISKITLFRKGLDRRLLINLGIPAVVFVIIGGLLTTLFKTSYLEVFLGLFLVSLSILFLVRRNLTIRKSKLNAVIGGSLSGLFAGLLGTGGAIRGLTMASFNLRKNAFIATSAVIDLGVDTTRTFVYWHNGFITKELLIFIPFLFVIGWLGTWIGKELLKEISQKSFKSISLYLILLIGIFTLFKALQSFYLQ
ncbi:sulfite exporter TauE/SafE family protein [Saprospiraceae bacterium]|nr:sulfite exporter TauE/SafE family protein [Saprospiraceae bacterium]